MIIHMDVILLFSLLYITRWNWNWNW